MPGLAGGSTRCGFIAILGRPNVGKSTLLNRFAGQKVAIVSSKPQTTRHRVRAVLDEQLAQFIFVDTPGLQKPQHLLGESLVKEAREALQGVDAVLLMVDGNLPAGPGDRYAADLAAAAGKPVFLVLNKVDRGHVSPQNLEGYRQLGHFAGEVVISAQRGTACAKLLRLLSGVLPTGPKLFGPEDVTDQSLRQLAGELIREQVLRQTEQEVPHSVAVRVEDWVEERDDLTRIASTIFVERESQKGILIGKSGTRLKEIGQLARVEIERQIGHQVFLELWVKVLPNWRRNQAELRRLGYVVD